MKNYMINSFEICKKVEAKSTGAHSGFMTVAEAIGKENNVDFNVGYIRNRHNREYIEFEVRYIPLFLKFAEEYDNCNCKKKTFSKRLNTKEDCVFGIMSSFKSFIPILEKEYEEYKKKHENDYKYSLRDIIENINVKDIYSSFKATIHYSNVDYEIVNAGVKKKENILFNDMDGFIKFLKDFSEKSSNEQFKYVMSLARLNNENDKSKRNYINQTIKHVLPILLDKYETKEYNNGEQLEFKNNDNNVLDEILNKICNIFKQLEVIKLDNSRLIIDGIILLTLDKKDKELKAFSRYDVILIANDFNYEDIFKKIIDRRFSYSGN